MQNARNKNKSKLKPTTAGKRTIHFAIINILVLNLFVNRIKIVSRTSNKKRLKIGKKRKKRIKKK